MGSFANTVFSVMLGWLQGLVSVIWSALTSEGDNPSLKFFENNWLRILIVLCIAGAAADFIVYIFRWKPYKVWLSFLRRLKSGDKNADAAENPKEVFSLERNEVFSPERNAGESYDLLESADDDDSDKWCENKTANDSSFRIPEVNIRRRRRRINSILSDSNTNDDFHYYSPHPMVDRNEAYHAPVYPEKWTGSGDQES